MSQKGLSLIELMVAIAVFSILAMAGAAFTGSWSNSNRVYDAENQIYQGFSLAKAQALRNEFAIVDGKAAATLCLTDATLSVHIATSTAPASCATPSIWSNQLNDLLTVTANGAAFACVCLSSKGRLTQVGSDCAACTLASNVNIRSGSENKDVSLY